MKQIQFSHANGFPGSSYNYLFSLLSGVDISYVEKIGHGDYPLNNDLQNYAQELIDTVEKQQNFPIIGMGHSAGAVITLIAAALRPDLFEQVILLDPVLFSKRKRYLLKLIKRLGMIDKITPAQRTERRRAQFKNREEARAYFRTKSLFKPFHPACFEDYINYGLECCDGGLQLSISPEIEADIFRNVPLKAPNWLKQVSGTLIFGKHSDLFSQNDKKWWQRNFPHIQIREIDGGHLFPFEKPDETATMLQQLLTGHKE